MKPTGSSWPTYLRQGLGRRLSKLGEGLGWHWLTYNPLQFQYFHEEGLRNAPGVARAMHTVFPQLQTAVDVGAGSGMFAAELKKLGVHALACEHNARGRRIAATYGVDSRPFDLNVEPPAVLEGGPFDLAYSFEVAEHLPVALGDRLVRFLCELAPAIIFSAAPPGQGGTGHINEQPKEYWVERFARHDRRHRTDLTAAFVAALEANAVKASWFRENSMVFST